MSVLGGSCASGIIGFAYNRTAIHLCLLHCPVLFACMWKKQACMHAGAKFAMPGNIVSNGLHHGAKHMYL